MKPRPLPLTPTLDVPHDDITTTVGRDQLIAQREEQAHFLFVTVVTHYHLYGEQTGSKHTFVFGLVTM